MVAGKLGRLCAARQSREERVRSLAESNNKIEDQKEKSSNKRSKIKENGRPKNQNQNKK